MSSRIVRRYCVIGYVNNRSKTFSEIKIRRGSNNNNRNNVNTNETYVACLVRPARGIMDELTERNGGKPKPSNAIEIYDKKNKL